MVGGAQEEEVCLAADQLDQEGGGAVLLVFAVEAEHALVGVGLGDGHQHGIAQVFAHEQEEGCFGLDAAAQLMVDQVDARRIGGGAEEQLAPGAVGIDLQAEGIVVDQQGGLDAAGAEGGLQLGGHAGGGQGIEVCRGWNRGGHGIGHQRGSGAWLGLPGRGGSSRKGRVFPEGVGGSAPWVPASAGARRGP